MPTLRTVSHLVDDFNLFQGQNRLLAVVSPTCPGCQETARLVTDALVAHPSAPVLALFLWMGILPDDNPTEAHAQAGLLGPERRLRHYWEGEGWSVSSALRPVLGIGDLDPARSAWDVCLHFPAGVRWEDEPPIPEGWVCNTRYDPGGDSFGRISAGLLGRWLDG
ncbi:MAG TPA: hypothetical protein VE990_17600 [Acidimicrobiales bacterium]|nr:hypothetical protein [Acidimicrobiales bacterium]